MIDINYCMKKLILRNLILFIVIFLCIVFSLFAAFIHLSSKKNQWIREVCKNGSIIDYRIVKNLNGKNDSNDWNDKVSLDLKIGYDERYRLESDEKILQYSPEYISLITIDVKYEIIDDVNCNNYMIHDFDYFPVKFCGDKNLDYKIQNDWKDRIV